MSKLPYTARNDHMFKRIFGDSRDVSDLTAFLQATLDLPDEDYEEVTIVDPKLHPERPDDKWGVLDVLVRLRTGKMVDIEIQVCDRPDLRERAVFYLARMVSSQIGAGEDYDHIKRTISILITDFVLVTDSASYHNSYMLRDARTGSQFTDLLEIVTLELPKLPKNPDGSKMWPWLKFIDTDEREELLMLPEKNPQLKHAVGKLMELTADEREQMLAEAREKGRRDIAAMLKGARIEG
ncbi:MAG: Rpn family recombination-promoting nuclease/putative transposase, partial [Azoarcus sp.]|nr:Rpn family recombination-promoting nuclease/putative transposase [Azoarcus sp.]